MNFNEYWKEKELKRRKSWVGKAKRLADQHKNLEQIRVDVYLPIDYTANVELDDYKELPYVKKNPVIDWHKDGSPSQKVAYVRQWRLKEPT